LQVLSGIIKQYPNLFGEGSSGGEGVSGETFESRWGWIAVINNLSNNDRSRWAYYEDMNVTEFLNTVVFYKEKSEAEQKWQQANQ
jgi:hypothetical protein